MDIEKLIILVRDHSEIYDLKHPKHRNFDYIGKLWKHIAEKLQTTDTDAKTKWQNLRSNYMREKRKIDCIASGSAAENAKACWPFFTLLTFLDDSLKHRRGTESISEMDSDEKFLHKKNEYSDFNKHNSENLTQVNANFNSDFPNALFDISRGNKTLCEDIDLTINDSSVSKKRKKSNYLDDNDVDKMYLKHLEKMSSAVEEYNNPDFMFLKSLHPEIKKLKPLDKLEFKSEVIELLKHKLTSAFVPDQFCSTPTSVGSGSGSDYYNREKTTVPSQFSSNVEESSNFNQNSQIRTHLYNSFKQENSDQEENLSIIGVSEIVKNERSICDDLYESRTDWIKKEIKYEM